jgi:hypothetical protein
MTCWPVSAGVGNVKNNVPSLIEPIAIRVDQPQRALNAAAIRSHSSRGTDVTSPQTNLLRLASAHVKRPFDNSDSFYKSSRNQEAG